jgi:Fe-S-cluster-containing hydrogenase component 2
MQDAHAVPVDPMKCAVGCSTCANICPTNAISFPTLDAVWKLERERQIFRTVKKEAQKKHDCEGALKAREAAQKALSMFRCPLRSNSPGNSARSGS